MTYQEKRQAIINILWSYDSLSECEVEKIANKIMSKIHECD